MTSELLHHGEATPSGRPRDDLREQAILDAAIELLTEVGYDRMSIDTLAARARASKATIYRRWSGKAEVVTEAVRRHKCPASTDEEALPDTGTLRGDLLEFVLCSMASPAAEADAALFVGVLRAMRDDPELNALMRTHVFGDKHFAVAALVARAVRRGELTVGTDPSVTIEAVEALVFSRLLIDGRPLDAQFLTHLIDDVALPLLRS